MAERKVVQQDDIVKMNDLYLELKTYAAVARAVGFSASTVKKYIIADYVPLKNLKINLFTAELIPIQNIALPITHEGWSKILRLSEEERLENEELRKEIQL